MKEFVRILFVSFLGAVLGVFLVRLFLFLFHVVKEFVISIF